MLKVSNHLSELNNARGVSKSRFTMDSTQTDQSVYQALDATTSEIRVMILHQGSGDEELRCTLKTVSLDDDQPAFHALSYAWPTTETEKCRINIDNNVVPVASSLATLLDHFRSSHYDFLELHSVSLWIDAICINQTDPDERAQQVRLMGRIYRQASCVLVWLGEGDEFSDYALDRINDATFRASCGELETASRAPIPDEVRVSTIIGKNLDIRRYWTRAWTLQEFVLATQDPVMFCGSRWMLWSWYDQCDRALPYHKGSYPGLEFDLVAIKREVPLHHDDKPFVNSMNHRIMRNLYQHNGSIPLIIALNESFELDATDPRDLIYGVLGLVPHHEMLMVDIDYEKPPERVFTDTMAAIWTSGERVLIGDIIPRLITASCPDDKSEVPSWVPNVLKRTTTDLHGGYAWLLASRQWRPERQADILVEGSILTIKAIQFDSIAETLKLDFNHDRKERFHRGNAPMEVDIEPLEDIEAMAQRGLNIAIPASSRLAPFLVLRDKMPIWSSLTAWEEVESGSESEQWVPGLARDKPKLWEVLLGRQEIPEGWKMAYSPKLRNYLPALEAAILSPFLQAMGRKIDEKQVFTTRSGFLGVGTKYVEAGDIITLIVRMKFMYVLRPFRDGYRIVGFANVSGLMDWDDLDQAMEAGTLHEEKMKIY